LKYFPQWQAKVLWGYKIEVPHRLTFYYDYTNNRARFEANNNIDVFLPDGGPGQSLEIWAQQKDYELDHTDSNFCEVTTFGGSIDRFYPFQGAKYVDFSMAPRVNRLGLHFANVSLSFFIYNSDVWVDAFTGSIMYVEPTHEQDLGFFIYEEFLPSLDAKTSDSLFTLPAIIEETCIRR